MMCIDGGEASLEYNHITFMLIADFSIFLIMINKLSIHILLEPCIAIY